MRKKKSNEKETWNLDRSFNIYTGKMISPEPQQEHETFMECDKRYSDNNVIRDIYIYM
jgi:hypothetical protein